MGTRDRLAQLKVDPGSIRRSSAFQRRTLLQSWCGVFFSVLSLSACTSATRSSAEDPVTLTISIPESTLDTAESGIRTPALYLSQEALTFVNVEGRATPRLAREWKWEDDGRILRMTLNDGVKAHDGTDVTAAVVAATLNVVVGNPATHVTYPSFANVKEVRSTGDDEIVFELSRPSAYLPEDLDFPLAFGSDRNGTGPFRIIDQQPQQIVLERFDQYRLGPAQIERIVIQAVPTLRTAWTGLLRAETDMVTNVPPDALEFISNESVQIISFARAYQYAVGFNARTGPLRSPSVRKALNLAINRDALIASVLKGRGTPSTGPIWPQHWAYDTSTARLSFDPNQATLLLDSAGYPARPGEGRARFSFTCLIPAGFALVERVALDIQKQLYDIGVDIQFEAVSIAEFNTRVRDSRFEAMLIEIVSGFGFNHSELFWRSSRNGKGLNVFGYENAEAERLFALLSESVNEAAIRSATGRLQRALVEDPPALFVAWSQSSRAIRRRFQVVEEPTRDPLFTISRWTVLDGDR